MSESRYERDPRVDPVHVEKLGKHHPMSSAKIPVESTADEEHTRAIDRGPTYDDFLEHDPTQTDLSDATG